MFVFTWCNYISVVENCYCLNPQTYYAPSAPASTVQCLGKRDDILSLTRNGEPRMLREIEANIGGRCSSSVTYLFQKSAFLASPIRYFSNYAELFNTTEINSTFYA